MNYYNHYNPYQVNTQYYPPTYYYPTPTAQVNPVNRVYRYGANTNNLYESDPPFNSNIGTVMNEGGIGNLEEITPTV